jgi:hypothetical protein
MIAFPLLLIPLAIYNIIAFLMRDVSFDKPLVQFALKSGDEWPLALSEMLLALGIVLLLFEVIKGARPGSKFLTDHVLSLLVFAGAAAEFVLLPRFGTTTFFLLTLLALVEFFAGIALHARRSVHVVTSVTPASRTPVRKPISDPPEPQFEPVATAAVARESVVEHPIIANRPEPVIVHAGVVSSGPSSETHSPEIHSPEVRSPDLQPSEGVHRSPEPPAR